MSEVTAINLEGIFHSRARLAIVAYLSTAGGADFTLLREYTKLTDGNLSTHLRKLEAEGYVEIKKGFVGRKPRTSVLLSEKGKTAFSAYLDDLERIIRATRESKGTP